MSSDKTILEGTLQLPGDVALESGNGLESSFFQDSESVLRDLKQVLYLS